jgi:hypothetical protein
MDKTKTIDKQRLYREIDTLEYTDKLYLLSYITDNLIQADAGHKHNLTELKGLGKGTWTNIDRYILSERESWE